MTEPSYKITRSKRRTIALIITKAAKVEVRAPLKASLGSIEQFVNKHKTWIEKKTKERKDFINKHQHCTLSNDFEDGNTIIYEGISYKLQISDHENIHLTDTLHFPKKFLPQAKQYLTIWLKHKAIKKIIERVEHFTNITQLKSKDVKITSAKGIWGSCNSKGFLSINWRLIMAPPHILDYIVVHELMHLDERNHSKHFWQKVEKVLPDYKKHEKWLKENGDILLLV